MRRIRKLVDMDTCLEASIRQSRFAKQIDSEGAVIRQLIMVGLKTEGFDRPPPKSKTRSK